MTGWPSGGGGGSTWRLMVVLPDRPSASVIVTASDLAPVVVPGATVALKLKLLPPLLAKACVGDPPMDDRSALTWIPVLAGFAPGVTETVRSEAWPGKTVLGLAEPAPEGFVIETAVPVIAMSSIPIHSSLPTASVVITRIWTRGWFSAVVGRVTLTGVTAVARLGPVLASATKPSGTFVKLPLAPTRNCRATGWTALSVEPSMSRRLYATWMAVIPVVLMWNWR